VTLGVHQEPDCQAALAMTVNADGHASLAMTVNADGHASLAMTGIKLRATPKVPVIARSAATRQSNCEAQSKPDCHASLAMKEMKSFAMTEIDSRQ